MLSEKKDMIFAEAIAEIADILKKDDTNSDKKIEEITKVLLEIDLKSRGAKLSDLNINDALQWSYK